MGLMLAECFGRDLS
jgi:geranylgeranyl pyrophosphate synthase